MEASFSDNKSSGLEGLGLEGHAAKNGTGNGAANGAGAGLDFKLPAEDQIRFRGVQQEIPHFGAPPKRTESLYMKAEAGQPVFKVGNGLGWIKIEIIFEQCKQTKNLFSFLSMFGRSLYGLLLLHICCHVLKQVTTGWSVHNTKQHLKG